MSRGQGQGKGAGHTVTAWMGYLRGRGVAPGPVTPAVDRAAELLAGTADAVPDVTGDVAEALCAALVEAGDTDRLARCAAAGGRDLAKAARRALHGLRRQGAAVPRRRGGDAGAPAADRAPVAHADARAHLFGPFGDGNRVLLFRFRGQANRTLHAGLAELSDDLGLRDLRLYRGGAKVYRTMVTESRTKLAGAELPFGHALHRVKRAAAVTQGVGRLVPESLPILRDLLGSDWPTAVAHPAAALAAGAVPDDAALMALWERPELRTWLPAEATLAVLTAGFSEALSSTLVISEAQRRARLAEILDRAVAGEVDAVRAPRWAERLGDAAWVLHANGAPAEAAAILAVRAQVLEATAPGELPFFRQLVGRVLLGRLPPGMAADLVPGLPREGAAADLAPEPGGVIWTPDSSTEPTEGAGSLIIPGR